MDAVISGRAGRALLLDGTSLTSFDVDEPHRLVERQPSDLRLIFGEATDLRTLENVQVETVAHELRLASDRACALDLALITLDSDHSVGVKGEAAVALGGLLGDEQVCEYVENVLYGRPLPGSADIEGAIKVSLRSKSSSFHTLLVQLLKYQPLIRRVCLAWDAIPTNTFGGREQQTEFQQTAVHEGLFRRLTILLEGEAEISRALVLSPSVQAAGNHREILQEWVTNLGRQQTQPATTLVDEERDSSVKDAPAHRWALRLLSAIAISACVALVLLALSFVVSPLYSVGREAGPPDTYLTVFLISLFLALFLTPVVRRFSTRLFWLDVTHDVEGLYPQLVTHFGGVSVFISILIALLPLAFVDGAVAQELRRQIPLIKAVFVPAVFLFLFGVYSDSRSSKPSLTLAAQLLAGTALFYLGGRVEMFTVPFVGSFALPPILSFIFTVVWVVVICNAFKLIEGPGGLAAGGSLFSSLVMLAVALVNDRPLVAVASVALAGALIGFLRYNFNPASVFLGDSGSLFIGFLLAALSVIGSQKSSTVVAVAIPLMAFALPVIDTGFAIVRRFISGRPLFEGDREHIHHKLLERGWSPRRVAFALYGVCALFGLLALFFTSDGGGGRLTGLVLLITGAAVVLIAGRLRYHEVDEIQAGLRRNISERRIRAANHVRVRRASRAMAAAKTLGDIFGAVREMLELGEFVYASVQIGRMGDQDFSEKALAREVGDIRLRDAKVQGGLICWEWGRGDLEVAEIDVSHFFWTVRLPLSTDRTRWGYITLYREFGAQTLLIDMNYLSNLFQREMSLAVERALEGGLESRTGLISKLQRSR